MIELTKSVHLFEREDWGARDPLPMAAQGWRADEAFLHHSADPRADVINTLEKQKEHMQFVQDFHMGPQRGWADIAYHFVVFQPYGNIPYARIFEGRARNMVPAAQQFHNTGTLAICVVGDFMEDKLMVNTRYAIEVLLRRYPRIEILGLHRNVNPTECPGTHIALAQTTIAAACNLKLYRP